MAKARATSGPKLIIGGLEDIGLPEWGIAKIRARVDTGARTSAIHVEDLKRLKGGRVRFSVVCGWRGMRRRSRVTARVTRMTPVRPSTGQQHMRYTVRTVMTLGPVERTIELTLADRSHMTFRMLLGRTALGRAFLVDPGRICVLSKGWPL